MLLVHFGYLSGDRTTAIRSEMLRQLFQRLDEPEWRFIENHRAGLRLQRGQERLPSLFLRKEALEAETVAGQAGGNDGRDAGRRSGKGLHLDPFLRTRAGQQETGIGDAGRAGIADEGDVQSPQDAFLHQLDGLVPVSYTHLTLPTNREV